ncbi:MAG TPA: LuxR C-terminal-related transcriptional regulator [Coleofasciculaceae cyanobacterium]|jgi:DNA-binding CsgD family transcriptional regulator
MVILASQLNTNIKTVDQSNYSEKQSQGTNSQNFKQPSLLQAILESLVDGVLVLTMQGEWVYANESARQIFHQLSYSTSVHNSALQAIWSVCKSLIDSGDPFSEQEMMINNVINPNSSVNFRIRVRWLILEESAHPYLLVTIEDQLLSKQMQAIAQTKTYGLTHREAEVWSLHQANLSYKEIADKLYITRNTVKKHLKNIYAKQQNFLEKNNNKH